MELGDVGRLRRSARTEKTRAPAKTAPQGGVLQSRARNRADRLNLSAQALRLLEADSRRVQQRLREREGAQAEGSSELDVLDKSLKVMYKCERIAARVMAGDKVPPEDLRYLRMNDPDGYKLALAMRKPKKHPKKYKSMLDDEDRQQVSGEDTSAPQEVSAPAQAAPAEAPSGGGESE